MMHGNSKIKKKTLFKFLIYAICNHFICFMDYLTTMLAVRIRRLCGTNWGIL